MANALHAAPGPPRLQSLYPRHEPLLFEKIAVEETGAGTAGRACPGGARKEKYVRFDPRVIDVALLGPNRHVPKKKREALWLIYLVYGVLFVLVVGLMISVGSGLRRPPKVPGRRPRAVGASAIDCVRIVSSPNSTLVDGALDEVARIGLAGSRVSVQSLPLDTGSHKRGCYNAHVAAHAWAVENKCRNTMVLEDDVVFADDPEAVARPIERLIDSGVPFSTLWLGYTAIRVDPVADVPGTVYLQKPMLAHAIVFSRQASERIAALPPWTARDPSILSAYDVVLWHQNVTDVGATFGADPPVAAQLASRPHSYSLDKNWFQDLLKTFNGMRMINFFARERCSTLYQFSPAAERVMGLFTTFSPDTRSVHRVYTCDDVATADDIAHYRKSQARWPSGPPRYMAV